MRFSVVAGLIVGVHVVVIASVALPGCTSTRTGEGSTVPAQVETAQLPPMPPTVDATDIAPAPEPVTFPAPVLKPPTQPAPVADTVAAGNVYVVKSGDSLSKIAAAHGVKTAELKELNKISDANKIRIGQKLILPDYSKPSTSKPASVEGKISFTGPAKLPAGGEYVVKSGDALSKIAVAHGLKVKALMEANGITDANKIRIGQKLKIPAAAPKAEAAKAATVAPVAAPAVAEPAVPAPEASAAPVVAPAPVAPVTPAPAVPAVVPVAPAVSVDVPLDSDEGNQEDMLDYTVQSDDTVEGVARLFVVSKDEILRINNLAAGEELKVGTVIKIPPSTL